MAHSNQADEPCRLQSRRGAIGVLTRDACLLMVRRAAGVAKPGYWCFPGGHIEPGETSRVAVIRELAEELGIVVKPETRLGLVRVTDSGHVLSVWAVRHVSGRITPAPAEVAEVRWMSPTQIRTIERRLPSNLRVLAMLGL